MTANDSLERGNSLGNNGNRRIRIVGMLAANVSLCMVLTLEWLLIAVLTVLTALVRTKKRSCRRFWFHGFVYGVVGPVHWLLSGGSWALSTEMAWCVS